MSDLIDRQAAIDVLSLGKEILSRVLDDIDVVGIDREKYSWGLKLIESNIEDMKELPSAQSEIRAEMSSADTISRQAAIDALDKRFDSIPMEQTAEILQLRRDLRELPSAQPEQRWISCSERLPDNDTYVLISKNPHPLTGEKWCVTIAARFADGRSREIQWRDIGFGRLRDVEVIAWMPLPEPYKTER